MLENTSIPQMTSDLETYVNNIISSETHELMRLCNVVSEAAQIQIINGNLTSTSRLTSEELEVLAMRIPAECLCVQSKINQHIANNVFKDLDIETKITRHLSELIKEKGNADERKRRAELQVLNERTVSLANKTIIKGLQACIDRADKVYEGIKKVMDFRAKESWFDRKGPSCPR